MAKGSWPKWDAPFQRKEEAKEGSGVTVRNVLKTIMSNLNESEAEQRPGGIVPLGHGDPSAFPCFRTTPVAEDAIVEAIRSAKFNCYAPAGGIEPARRSVAEHLSRDLPYKLSPDDVYLTAGANHAIEVLMTALARPGANILLPRPGYPLYETRSAFSNLEFRHFDLLPERGWEVDLDGVEALVNDKTVAMVIINPGNPCGNVFTVEHMKKIAETARKLGILVIADEVYGHLAFGSNAFVPMGVFGSITPVLTVGSISKRWIIPGWRLGWIVTTDPTGILQKSGAAVIQTLEETTEDFFLKTTNLLRDAASICYDRLKEIPCITCPHKPEGAMSTMVKLNLSLLKDITDDMDFCTKLAKEESVVVLPGFAVGLKDWLRITFAIEPSSLEVGLARIKAFYLRHAKKQ